MSPYRVNVLARAERDVLTIAKWLAKRSPKGSTTWLRAFQSVLDKLAKNPLAYGVAPESPRMVFEIRQVLFKTPRGRPYRALYTIDQDEVRILRVRRPGHRPLRRRDLS